MSRNRQGLPYLKSSLKYLWNSTSVISDDDLTSLFASLSSFLIEKGFVHINPQSSHSSVVDDKSPESVDFENEHGCIGFQNVLDSMFSGKAKVVLIENDIISPSAINMCLGIYVENCSNTTSTYGVAHLNAKLAPILKRKMVEAVALYQDSEIVRDIQKLLTPVTTVTPKNELTSAGLYRSQAKTDKRKL